MGDNVTSRRNGKEKEVATDHEPADDSVMSRIGNSAVSLSKSILKSTPTASDLASVATSEKAGSASSTRPSTVGESSSASLLPGANVFRSGQADTHAAAEEAAFSDFLDSTSVFVATEPTGLEKAWQVAASDERRRNTGKQPTDAAISSVADQQSRDGAEVVDLLSRTDEEFPRFDENVTASGPELDTLRQALFGDESAAQVSATDWNNILNFIPEFLRAPSHGSRNLGLVGDSVSTLGVTEPAEAGQLWIEQWNRVLTSYTNEVWGDLGDLVEEAREEVQQIEEKSNEDRSPPDTKALRRLQQILTHVRAKL